MSKFKKGDKVDCFSPVLPNGLYTIHMHNPYSDDYIIMDSKGYIHRCIEDFLKPHNPCEDILTGMLEENN